MHNKKLQERSTGFTLVELLVTLLLISILITWVSADSSEIRQRALIDQTAKNLNDAVQYGQDYARQLTVPSALCAGSPEDQCQSTDWSKGWTLFQADPQNPGNPLQAIRVFDQNTPKLNLQLTNAKQASKIIFNGEGFVDLNANQATQMVVCSSSQNYHAVVVIEKSNLKITTGFEPTNQSESCKNAV